MNGTHGLPQSVSAIIVLGKMRAKPKSATLSRGTPSGWPHAWSAAVAGARRRFCGLMSRWMRLRVRRNLRACAECGELGGLLWMMGCTHLAVAGNSGHSALQGRRSGGEGKR